MTSIAPERLPLTAAILAGGRSTRMGVDKILLDIQGELLIRRVLDAVTQTCARIAVVTNRPGDLAVLGLPLEVSVLSDEIAYQGPLGGLATALAWTQDEWVLAVAADIPWIEPAVVRALWAARGQAAVVVPVTDHGPEPLLALYHRRCLPVVNAALAAGRLKLRAILEELPVVRVPAEALRQIDANLASFENINTPEDLARAVHQKR